MKNARIARYGHFFCCEICVDCDALIASKLAPTVDLGWIQSLRTTEIKCGSELARDGGSRPIRDPTDQTQKTRQ